MLTLGILVMNGSLIGTIEALLKVNHKHLISQKVVNNKGTKNIAMIIHLSHPHKVIQPTLTNLQEEMMGVEVEANIVLPVTLDPSLILTDVDIMVIMVPPVGVVVASK